MFLTNSLFLLDIINVYTEKKTPFWLAQHPVKAVYLCEE